MLSFLLLKGCQTLFYRSGQQCRSSTLELELQVSSRVLFGEAKGLFYGCLSNIFTLVIWHHLFSLADANFAFFIQVLDIICTSYNVYLTICRE